MIGARLRYLVVSVVQTLLRMLPFPCRTGLVRIGNRAEVGSGSTVDRARFGATVIEEALDLIVNWKVDTVAARNSASYRLRPLVVAEPVKSVKESVL